MRGRLLERLEESVEGLKRKHMDLVDDVDAVTAYLRRDTDLFGQRTNIVHRVVRCGVQFVDIERAALVERPARLALVAGLAVGGRIEAVDRLGENARAGRFADAARTAEQVSVGQLPARDRVAQRRCDMRLPDDRRECRGTVLAGGNDEIIHDFSYLTKIRKFGRNPQAARKIPDREQRHLRLLQTQGRTTDTSICRGRNSRNGPGSCVDSARCRRAHLGFRRTRRFVPARHAFGSERHSPKIKNACSRPTCRYAPNAPARRFPKACAGCYSVIRIAKTSPAGSFAATIHHMRAAGLSERTDKLPDKRLWQPICRVFDTKSENERKETKI